MIGRNPVTFGPLLVESDDGAVSLYLVMARQGIRFSAARARFLWKVLRGRHELADAIQDLAMARATRALWEVVQAGRRLRRIRRTGGSAAEVDVLRIAFRAASVALSHRIEANDFYQDTNRVVGIHIRRSREVS